MSDIKAPCLTKYKAVHTSGARTADQIRYLIIHCTEGDTAEGAASWFANQASGGSANLVVDDDMCFRTVDDLEIPWAAPPRNSDGFHIEIAGYSSWSKARWLLHLPRIRRAAFKAAQRCKKFHIPLRWCHPQDLELGRRGITSHNNVSLVWKQSDHTDPGPHFPYTLFMQLVKYYYKRL